MYSYLDNKNINSIYNIDIKILYTLVLYHVSRKKIVIYSMYVYILLVVWCSVWFRSVLITNANR